MFLRLPHLGPGLGFPFNLLLRVQRHHTLLLDVDLTTLQRGICKVVVDFTSE